MKTLRLTHRPLRMVAATLVLAVAGGVTVAAYAAPGGGGPMHDPMMMMGSGHRVDRMLDAVNATPEQRTQIRAIVDAAHADLRAQHEAGRSLRQQSLQLFTQPTVDARAAESLRQQMLAQHDQTSKRMLQAMLDVSRVLTPEQRKQIGDQMTQMQARMEQHRAERQGDRPAR